MEEGERPDGHEADLSAAMEHLRPYVSVAATARAKAQQNSSNPAAEQEGLDNDEARADHDVYGVPAEVINPPRHPASVRSEQHPQKRTDPFQFGSRLLTDQDDIFEFNAWDHVEIDPAFAAFSELQYAVQRENPVSEFDRQKYNANPEKFWDRFYRNNTANFFKDRKWLFQEFPVLKEAIAEDRGPVTVLEVGAGAGNTAFPILKENKNPHLRLHACDYAQSAVEVMRQSSAYDPAVMAADVWDAAGTGPDGPSLPPGLAPQSVDIVVMIFIFSALAPAQWAQALANIYAVLKPGGQILFRDYGRGDLAQVRFKKGRWLADNFYIRGDGTRVYFFEQAELQELFGARFAVLDLGVDRRMLVNRQRRLKMYRCWMQGRFQKAAESS